MTFIGAWARLSGSSWVHGVLPAQGIHVGLPNFFEAFLIGYRGRDHLEREGPLFLAVARFHVEAQGILRKIAHHDVEDLIQEIIFHFVERAAFQDELAVSDKGENFPSAPRACRQPPQGGVLRVRSSSLLPQALVERKDVQLHLPSTALEQRHP